MKNIKTIIASYSLLVAGIVSFSSCSSEEDEVMQGDNLLKIKTSIADTRAVVTGTEFQEGDEIGVFLGETNNANIKASYSGSKWTIYSDILLSNSNNYVYACYPYESTATVQTVQAETKTTIRPVRVLCNIDITPKSVTGQPDYMYGCSEAVVNATNTTANIQFKHALSRITLSITKGANDVGNGKISKVCLRNRSITSSSTAIAVKGVMNLNGGSITRTLDADAAIELSVDKTVSTKEATTIDILAIPTTVNENAEIVLTIDGAPYTIVLSQQDWEAGEQYTYPIIINRQSPPQISSAKIGDYYYSDGTWSSYYNESKICVGIVFALSEEKGGDINVGLSESSHGRVVALNDLGSYAWGPVGDITEIPNYVKTDVNHYRYCALPLDGKNTYYSNWYDSLIRLFYSFVEWPTNKDTNCCLTDYAGSAHSALLRDDSFPAASMCYKKALMDAHNGYKIGAWYLPSIGEFARLAMAYGIGEVCHQKQNLFANLYTGDYWTSSESDLNSAWIYDIYSGYVAPCDCISSGGVKYTKQKERYVRPILAF